MAELAFSWSGRQRRLKIPRGMLDARRVGVRRATLQTEHFFHPATAQTARPIPIGRGPPAFPQGRLSASPSQLAPSRAHSLSQNLRIPRPCAQPPVAAASEQGKAAPPAGPPRAARPRLASARRPPAVLPGHSRSTVEVGAGSLRGGAVGGVGPRRGFPALRCASSPSARMPPNAHQVHPSFAPTPPPPPRAPRAPRLKEGGRATEETDDSRSVTRGRVRCKTRI